MASVATQDRDLRSGWVLPLCFVITFVLDLLTAARTVQGGDAGEFGVLGMAGGVAHPPGYPLYTFLARLFSLLPIDPPFFRIALTSAVCGAAAVTVIAAVGLRLTRNPVAAAGAALCLAVSPIFWQQSGVPEVFSLHALLTALVILSALRVVDSTATALPREATLLGALCGLGATNHQTIVLCAPLVIAAFVGATRTNGLRGALPGSCWFIPALLVGLVPYLLLLVWGQLDPATHSVWAQTGSWHGLLDHFLRREYGTFSLSQRRTAGTFSFIYVRECLEALVTGWAGAFFLTGLLGIVLLVRGRTAFGLGLLFSLVLAAIFFPSLINLPFVPVSREIALRFFILPMVLLAPFVAVGLDAGLRHLGRTAGALLVGTVLIVVAFLRFPEADWRPDTAIQRYVVAITSDLPQGAVVLGSTDTMFSAMHWRAWVLRVRPDVHYIETTKLRSPVYRAQISREIGVDLPQTGKNIGPTAAFLAAHLPTFLIPGIAHDAGSNVPLEPWGLLLKALPDGAIVDTPEEQQRRLSRATQLFGDPCPAKSAWSSYVLASMAAPWDALAGAYEERGRTADAQAAKAIAVLFAPSSSSSRSEPE